MPTLNWIGKEQIINHHHDVPFHVLEHEYTYGDTNSENKIIHGDNLEALKSLLPEYEGKIKCIYIDPPYNTGNENWVYNDNVNHPKLKKWLGDVVGKEGEDLSRHDKWLCMMYPRLKLLHKLLREDGVIFISIDDNEQAHLKLLMDEVFGANNFVDSAIVQRSNNGMGNRRGFALNHEYLFCYSKSTNSVLNGKTPSKEYLAKFNKRDAYGQYKTDGILMKKGADSLREDTPNLFFPIFADLSTGEVSIEKNNKFNIEILPIKSNGQEGRWTWSKEKIVNDSWRLFTSPSGTVYIKDYLDNNRKEKPKSILIDNAFLTDSATRELKSIFEEKIFDTPKPTKLLKDVFDIVTDKDSNDIILDSFAGSGTTAHAVLNLNKEDNGNRKFILVEMEEYAENITAERVKRVIDGYGEGNKAKEGTGGGFEFLTVGDRIFDDNKNLNESIGIDKIRQYVYFSETKQYIDESIEKDNKYYMGESNSTGYYFYYEKENMTTLGYDYLATMSIKADNYVIYADTCTLSEDFMLKHNIIFKKIPRDISKI